MAIASKDISVLPAAETVGDDDLLVVYQGGMAKKRAASAFRGEQGESAYQVWLDEGNTGTEQDFLDSLKGTIEGMTPEQREALRGPQGPAGASPTITLTQITGGVSIVITDADGTVHQQVIVADGPVGPAPAISIGSVTTLEPDEPAVITVDPSSTATSVILNFALPRGQDGNVAFEDLTPAQLEQLVGPEGPKGDPFEYADFTPAQLEALRGPQGNAGAGVPSGGTAGQALVKSGAADYATAWQTLTWTGTQAQYDALGTYDANVTYYIVEAAT